MEEKNLGFNYLLDRAITAIRHVLQFSTHQLSGWKLKSIGMHTPLVFFWNYVDNYLLD